MTWKFLIQGLLNETQRIYSVLSRVEPNLRINSIILSQDSENRNYGGWPSWFIRLSTSRRWIFDGVWFFSPAREWKERTLTTSALGRCPIRFVLFNWSHYWTAYNLFTLRGLVAWLIHSYANFKIIIFVLCFLKNQNLLYQGNQFICNKSSKLIVAPF